MTIPLLAFFLACKPNEELSAEPQSVDDTSAPVPTGETGETGVTTTVETGLVPLGLVGEASILDSVDATVHLVRRIVLETEEPATAVMHIDDGESVRTLDFYAGPTTQHDLPVLGLLPDHAYTIEVVLTAESGRSVVVPVAFRTEVLGLLVPDTELLFADAARAEPGYTILSGWSTDLADTALAVDDQGRVVWAWEPAGETKSVFLSSDGVFSALVQSRITRRTVAGEVLSVFSPTDVGPATVLVDLDFHHEATFDESGALWSLIKEPVAVPNYPNNYTDPSSTQPTTVADDLAVKVAPDGTELGRWSAASLLDPTRIGFGSLDAGASGADWAHANAVFPIPGQDAFLMSLRHQDAIIKVNATTGELAWILANPDGWPAELHEKRLRPVGAVEWPYHAHGVKMVGDMVWMFDNGNDNRTTPYSLDPLPGPLYSRLVGYRVDEVAGTIEQVADLRDPRGLGSLYSQAVGNAQWLPNSGHVLGTYSFLKDEHGVDNEAIGRGKQSVRLIEWDSSTGDVVWDLSLSSQVAEAPKGWLVDRASRVSSLYLGIADETVSR